MARLYRLLILLYPRAFRSEYGAQLEQHFRDRIRDARRAGGTLGLARVWLETIADLVHSLRREWISAFRPDHRRARRPNQSDKQQRERIGQLMNGILKDVRYAFRTFRKEPGFTLAAVLTLGLGIGATTAIFSVVNGVVLKPLSYRDPDRLAVIYTDLPKIGLFKLWSSGPEIIDYREQSHLFEHIAYVNGGGGLTMTGEGDAEQVSAMFFSWDLLPLLGVTPALGRLITEEEDVPDGPRAVMLSYAFWERRIGSDPNIIGRNIQFSGNGYTVVGVMPPRFRLDLPPETQIPPTADIWVPSRTDLAQSGRHSHSLTPVARFAPGVTREQADAEMKVIAARLDEEHYERTGFQLHVYSLHRDLVQKARPALFALLGAVSFVLLIACANVANLILARGTAREKELALRTALGAARTRIVRQILTENMLLAIIGSAVALVLAVGGMRWLVTLNPANLPRLETISLDGSVLAFTAGAAVLTTFLFGLLPALQIVAPNLHESLKEGGKSHSAGRKRNRLRGALVISQVALSLMLLVGAGLMIRSFVSLHQVRPGFDPENILTFQISVPASKYEAEEVAPFYEQLEERIATLPGVRSVGSVSALPLSGNWGWSGTTRFFETTHGAGSGEDDFEVDRRIITPGYFQAMGSRLLVGRHFDRRDIRRAFSDLVRERESDGQLVTIIDQNLARRVWPGADPIGKRFTWGVNSDNPTTFEVVGVVEHLRHHELNSDGREQTYFPQNQFRFRTLTTVVRAEREPTALVAAVRRELKALDADIPAYAVRAMDGYMSQALAPTRFNLVLLAVFAAVGLVLAVVGIYGVIAYTVAQRTQELGIRCALGAQRGDVLSIVLRQGMALTLAGTAIGLVGAFALTRFVRSLLFGVTATDPLTYGGVILLLVAVSALACYLPARRATKVDPMLALRNS